MHSACQFWTEGRTAKFSVQKIGIFLNGAVATVLVGGRKSVAALRRTVVNFFRQVGALSAIAKELHRTFCLIVPEDTT